MSSLEAGDWALFRERSGSPLLEVFRESESVGRVEARNDDGTLRVTVYGPQGEPAFTLARVSETALIRTQRPPWGARSGTRRRGPGSSDDGKENAG